MTWRVTETIEQGMHLDYLDGGAPTNPGAKLAHRVKTFINLDSEPRRWRTSFDLPGVLDKCRREAIYGQRTVGAEFMCYQHDMLDPKKHTHHIAFGNGSSNPDIPSPPTPPRWHSDTSR